MKGRNPLARSGTSVGAALTALAAVAPGTPWYGFLGLAALVVIVEAIARPTERVEKKPKPLPRADGWHGSKR